MSGCCTAILDKNPDNAVVTFNAYIDGKLQNLKVDEDEDLYPKKRGGLVHEKLCLNKACSFSLMQWAVRCF